MRNCRILLLMLTLEFPLAAQFYPQGSQVISYFPHLVDGGPPANLWITSLTFVNPHLSTSAAAYVSFYDDNGNPLRLDFGDGATSTINFTVPPQGTATLTSKGASATTVEGWALVIATLPLEGVVQYAFSSGGNPQQSISVQATPMSTVFRSAATSNTGIAVANPLSNPLTVIVSAVDSTGNLAGQASFVVPALGHHAFNLFQALPALPSGFQGSVVLDGSGSDFVALFVSVNGSAVSNYPPSGLNWPISQPEDLLKVWSEVLDAGNMVVGFKPVPTLVLDGAGTVNAYANLSKNEVHVSLGLAELISDSESEVAFMMAHALGHLSQSQVGRIFSTTSPETDADEFAILVSLSAGYDPYGAGGALGKLVTASADATFLSQSFDNQPAGTDLHGFVSNRLGLIYADMQAVCSLTPDIRTACNQYRSAVHPIFPGGVPLSLPALRKSLRPELTNTPFLK
jgi:hypothetical protein